MDMVKRLSDEQVESFDGDFLEYHGGWDRVVRSIDACFPSGQFEFLDIGGGNGVFADRVLKKYKDSVGTVMDNSALILNRNSVHPRKTLRECSAEDIGQVFHGKKYDIVFFNWILHHLVTSSYRGTVKTIAGCLEAARELLSSRGRISIFENCYNSYSLERVPSRIIYHALSSQVLAAYTRRFGANTAGVGVCYLSEKLWGRTLADSGLKIESRERTADLNVSRLWKLCCHVRGISIVHFLCSRKQ